MSQRAHNRNSAPQQSPGVASRVSRAVAAGQRALADNRFDDAAREFRAAVKLAPSIVALHQALGIALTKSGKFSEAIATLRSACSQTPDNFELQMALAEALFRAQQFAESLDAYLRATQLNPQSAAAWSSLGAIYLRGGDPHTALRALRNAISIDPAFPLALGNAGLAFTTLGQYSLARDSFNAAINAKPDYDEMHWNRAIIDLLHGDFEHGWAGHEYRWVQVGRDGSVRTFREPRWNGERFDGNTLLLWAEQGLGDQLQFARFIPLVKARGGSVILQCSAPLKSLFERTCSAADEIVTTVEAAGSFDLQAPIMSLPYLLKLGSNLSSERVPYIVAPSVASPAIARPLPRARTRVRVGVIWAGQPKHTNDHNRSMALETLRPLFDVNGVEWYSVQKGEAAEAQIGLFNETSRALQVPEIVPLGSLLNDFVDTAHVVSQLDVVLTVDTAVAHLAGAMNVPVWLMLPHVPDWRWQLDRSDSPWYPCARIFRQSCVGDWSSVVHGVREALGALAREHAQFAETRSEVERAA